MPLVDLPVTSFWEELGDRGAAAALVSDDAVVSYGELAARVSSLVERLGSTRRLVLLEMHNDVASVVGYLACLTGGHPVLLVEPGRAAGLVSAYDPDVVLSGASLLSVEERRPGTRHDLHPELALLLSTSGTTGSPKLVRLSRRNVAANASAIATSLGIRPTDVAATTLPLHYCYGLSVLTSHLTAGACVALTSLSVVDSSFWDLVRSRSVTTFPGVPHTFELLDRVRFQSMELPSLRYLTCAGGRLEPATVRRYAALGQRRGFDLVVMYGATEATARMAYLPPDLALSRSSAIGIPVPGGSFSLRRPAQDVCPSRPSCPAEPPSVQVEEGELVYRGDNVMLGYAESAADLARGRGVDELRTGDLARRTPDGLIEIIGRTGRIAKVFGLRVDLSRVESALLEAGIVGYAADIGDRVLLAVDRSAAPVDVRIVRRVVSALGVPGAALAVAELDGIPRMASGKPDYAAICAQASATATATAQAPAQAPAQASGRPATDGSTGIEGGSTRHEGRLGQTSRAARRGRGGRSAPAGVAEVYAEVLGQVRTSGRDCGVGPGDSFVSLGGDSLSYVEASLRLERVLGHLPQRWHTMSVAELEARAAGPRGRATPAETPPGRPSTERGARRRGRTVETNVLLRAAAIVMIVGSHSNVFMLLGGAHLLVGLAGYNFGRFQLTDRPRAERVRRLGVSITRIVVPSVLWLIFAAVASAKYGPLNVVLLNGVFGTREWSEAWHYWFIEALVWTLVGLTVMLAVPWVDRLERARPFWLPLGLALLALLTRYDVVRLFGGDWIHRAHVIFWLFALGWAAVKAPTWKHRLLVSAVVAATVPGFFQGAQQLREATIVVGMLLLVWLPSVRVPVVVSRVAGVLASASLYIYLVHWQIYPAYEFRLPWLATGLSLASGIVFWWLVSRATPGVENAVRRGRRRLRGSAGRHFGE